MTRCPRRRAADARVLAARLRQGVDADDVVPEGNNGNNTALFDVPCPPSSS